MQIYIKKIIELNTSIQQSTQSWELSVETHIVIRYTRFDVYHNVKQTLNKVYIDLCIPKKISAASFIDKL